MSVSTVDLAVPLVRAAAVPIGRGARDYDPLLALVGDARLVLLGEGTHGTHEFYSERARITKLLIEEKGFAGVAVEADWPDAYRVNRWVRGASGDEEAVDALSGFKRFPTWMWRNADVLDFAGWLRGRNEGVSDPAKKVGFYGLDLYSLHASMEAVITYLDKVDPDAAWRARRRYACFERFGADVQAYGYAAGLGLSSSCEREVVAQLVDIRSSAAQYALRDGRVTPDDLFFAEENARLVRNAERYYRAMFGGRVLSWNLRDAHMTETLGRLLVHLGGDSRIVVWAHNSHLGNARATELGEAGEWNVGQLAKDEHGDGAVLVGFTTYEGTVTAASEWDGPAERKRVLPGLPGSFEALFHDVGHGRFLLTLRGAGDLATALDEPRLERAIGVLYLPETERQSHYFHARLSSQFDAVVHVDKTRAVEPLERTAPWTDEPPETFPSGV